MRLNKRTIAVSTASLVLVGGLSAFAYVSATGGGSGSASTITQADMSEVTVVPSISGALSPNGSADIVLTADNGNSFTVGLKTIAIEKGTPFPAGCSAADFTITQPAGPVSVAPGTGHVLTGFTTAPKIELADDTTDECLDFDVPLTVSVTRS